MFLAWLLEMFSIDGHDAGHKTNFWRSKSIEKQVFICLFQAYDQTRMRLDAIRHAGYNVVEYWEHDILARYDQDLKLREFFDDTTVITRLIPRDSFLVGHS